MNRVEETRLEWRRAQAELQVALATLERAVAEAMPSPLTIERARSNVKTCQQRADETLQRHITQLGKADDPQ